MPPAKYVYHYFNLKARGELNRLIFAAAGKEYEDHRIPFPEWKDHKKDMPFCQVPVLEIDGKYKLAQSYAIARYLAEQFGLAEKDVGEKAQTDMLCCVSEDIFGPVFSLNFEKDETRKAEMIKKFKDETAPCFFTKLDERLAKASSGFLVGNALTYADLALLVAQDFLEDILKENAQGILPPYPNVKKHREKIRALPKIAEWLKNRPESTA